MQVSAILRLVAQFGLLATPALAQSRSGLFEGAQIPPKVLAVLQRSCQPCHSDLASRRATHTLPVVAGQLTADSENGDLLNFSHWQQYKKRDRRGYLLAIASSVSSGIMPPVKKWSLRRRPRLTEFEKNMIAEWAIAEAKRTSP